jgi:hypothetical protein
MAFHGALRLKKFPMQSIPVSVLASAFVTRAIILKKFQAEHEMIWEVKGPRLREPQLGIS